MLQNYEIDENGVIKQVRYFKTPQKYDETYVNERYNTYGIKGTLMSYLRLGFINACLGEYPLSILDVGYGNGDFLNACKEVIPNCYGKDISNYKLPKGCESGDFDREYDVVTFFDSLEHFEDIYFVKDINTKYICISVPNCHNFSDEWFFNWKHRRPDEHLWHFNEISLIAFFDKCGYDLIRTSTLEDIIRKNDKDESNILTGFFKNRIKNS